MTDKNRVEIIMVLDSSGSMHGTISDARGGVNEFLDKHHKLPGEVRATIVLFNTSYKVLEEGRLVQKIPPMTNTNWVPRGGTALLDAVGNTIKTTGDRLASMPEDKRPDKVLMLIVTDGLENSSREYSKSQVKEMIEHQQDKYQWEFVYIGADQDGFAEGSGYGIKNASTFTNSSIGTRTMYQTVSEASASFLGGQSVRCRVPKVIPEKEQDDTNTR